MSQKVLSYIDTLLNANASDLFFTTGRPPRMKVARQFTVAHDVAPLSKDDIASFLALASKSEVAATSVLSGRPLNFEYQLNGSDTRFRLNATAIRLSSGDSGIDITMRVIRDRVPSFSEIGLALPIVDEVFAFTNGLVFCMGSTGSGKTTTLASLLVYAARAKALHVLSIEDPIEYSLFQYGVDQSEIGRHCVNYHESVLEALRRAPCLINVGECRDLSTIKSVILAANTGHIVSTTVHAGSCADLVSRLTMDFPADARRSATVDIVNLTRVVIMQRMVLGLDGRSHVLRQVLVPDSEFRRAVLGGDIEGVEGRFRALALKHAIPFSIDALALFERSLIDESQLEAIRLWE